MKLIRAENGQPHIRVERTGRLLCGETMTPEMIARAKPCDVLIRDLCPKCLSAYIKGKRYEGEGIGDSRA